MRHKRYRPTLDNVKQELVGKRLKVVPRRHGGIARFARDIKDRNYVDDGIGL